MRISLRSIHLALLFSATLPSAVASNPMPTDGNSELRPRTDRYGDPLPRGVIARLGTLRFRGVCGCLAFSPDGKMLAAATGEKCDSITFFDVVTGRAIRRIKDVNGVTKLAFSPDGKRLACSTRHCQVFETTNGKELFAAKGIGGDFSGDGKMLVTSDATESRGYVWDAATGRQLRQWTGAKGRKGYEGLLLAVGGQTVAILDWTRRTEVEVQDLATGKRIRSLRRAAKEKPNPGIPDGWRFLALARDGKTLAAVNNTAGNTGTAVELLDVESGKTVASWRGSALSHCVFSPDGKRLAWTGYGEQGGGTRLWVGECTADGGMRVVGEPVSTYGTVAPCFSPDGERVALVTGAAVVSLREAATGKKIHRLDAHEGGIDFVALTPDGRHVLSRSGGDLFAWETPSGRLLHRDPGPLVGREFIEHILPDGRLLTVDPDGDVMRLRDMLAARVDHRFAATRPNYGPPVGVPGPAGRNLAVHRRDGSVAVFDLRTGQCKYRLDAKEARQAMKLSDDGNILVWCSAADGKAWFSNRDGKVHVHVRNQETGKTRVLHFEAKTIDWVRVFAYHFCLSPAGGWLVVPTEDGRLRRWNLTTGEELSPLTESFWNIEELRWSPDGRFLIVCGEASKPTFRGWARLLEMRVWDVAAGARLAHLTMPRAPDRVRFSPNGRTMLTVDRQGVLRLREVATGKDRGQLRGHLSSNIDSLAVSTDGRMLVSGGQDSQVLVWDLTGRMPDGQWRSVRHPPEKLRSFWDALASDDAAAAYAAMWQLTADTEGSTAFLREHLKPVALPKAGQVARLIAALDAENFEERQRATRELEKLEESAALELRQTLKGKPTLEVRRRVEALLARLERVPSGEALRLLRAIEALEHIGTREARDVLRKLAEGAAAARGTREAQAARARLGIVEPSSRLTIPREFP